MLFPNQLYRSACGQQCTWSAVHTVSPFSRHTTSLNIGYDPVRTTTEMPLMVQWERCPGAVSGSRHNHYHRWTLIFTTIQSYCSSLDLPVSIGNCCHWLVGPGMDDSLILRQMRKSKTRPFSFEHDLINGATARMVLARCSEELTYQQYFILNIASERYPKFGRLGNWISPQAGFL